MTRRVALIIPALNEEGHMYELVTASRAQPVNQVIVVDNGSTDRTAEEASAAGAQVIHEPRRGYGYACAAGTREALVQKAQLLVYMDGDFSSLPHEIPSLLHPLADDKADLVLGSRVLGQIAAGSMPFHQRAGNWLSARLMNRLYQVQVTDLGPFRAIAAGWMERIHMQEMTFGWPTEMMVKVARRRGRIVEVPVSWHPRRSGRSKVGGTVRGSILAGYFILGVTLRYARG